MFAIARARAFGHAAGRRRAIDVCGGAFGVDAGSVEVPHAVRASYARGMAILWLQCGMLSFAVQPSLDVFGMRQGTSVALVDIAGTRMHKAAPTTRRRRRTKATTQELLCQSFPHHGVCVVSARWLSQIANITSLGDAGREVICSARPAVEDAFVKP